MARRAACLPQDAFSNGILCTMLHSTFKGHLEFTSFGDHGILPCDFLQPHKQVLVVYTKNDAPATPPGHSAANVVSNQPSTLPSFAK